jgi:hypothetical protein
VADVEEVKAAVGEDDGLAGGAPLCGAEGSAFEVEDLLSGGDAGARGEGGDEFMLRDRDGADLGDDDAGGEVGELDGGADLEATGDSGGEGGDDGVAGAGDVEDLAGACGGGR